MLAVSAVVEAASVDSVVAVLVSVEAALVSVEALEVEVELSELPQPASRAAAIAEHITILTIFFFILQFPPLEIDVIVLETIPVMFPASFPIEMVSPRSETINTLAKRNNFFVKPAHFGF